MKKICMLLSLILALAAIAPASLAENTVTSADNAFQNNAEITAVTLPASLIHIHLFAFGSEKEERPLLLVTMGTHAERFAQDPGCAYEPA